MTNKSLFDNTSGGWIVISGGLDNNYNFGVPFASTAGGYVVGLRWRKNFEGQGTPIALSLWDTVSGELKAQALAGIPNTAGVGWKTVALAEPVPLFTGREYRVCVQHSSGQAHSPINVGDVVAAPSPLLFGDQPFYQNVDHTAMPTTASTGVRLGVDVVWSDDGVLLPGSTGGTVGSGSGTATAGDLADWLDTAIGSQLHSAPLQNHTQLTALTSLLGVRGGSLAALSLWEALAYLASHIQDIKNAVDSGRAVIDTIRTWFSGAKPAEQDPIDTILNRIDLRSEGAYGASNALRGLPIFPGTGWSLQDVKSFDNDVAWDVPADLYVLVADPITPERPVTSVDGAPWRPRLGWWAVRNGDFFEGRQYIEFDHAHLINGGRRMPGVVIRLEPPSSGTLEAWTYALP